LLKRRLCGRLILPLHSLLRKVYTAAERLACRLVFEIVL
jgi:hypothetical protein